MEFRNPLKRARDNFHAPILIMGSSGSGKTTYAHILLPKHLEKLFPHKKYFLVYVMATRNALPHPIKVKELFEWNMSLEMDSAATVNAAELTMVVVIDEVGISSHEKQVSTGVALDAYNAGLTKVLTENKMAKDIQLVLLGTGLDKLTVKVNSLIDCQKIRLTPWSQDTVATYIDRVISNEHGSERAKTIKRLVTSNPVYKSLASNARSLSYLVDCLNCDLQIFEERLINRHFVVDRVVERHINANCLRSLKEEDRRVVVMIVWKALSDAKWNTKTPQWPELKADRFYSDDESKKIDVEACCNSLVDTNVELGNGGIGFVGKHKLAVSVSSALALVLVRLTSNKASLYIGTEPFEVAAAIHELECSYSKCFEDGTKPPCIKIWPSQQQFPGTQKEKIRIPSFGIETIVINEPRASYCDVISKDRIVQVKYSGDPDKTYASLDLDNELGKAGVLNKEAFNKIVKTMIATEEPKEAKKKKNKESNSLIRELVKAKTEKYKKSNSLSRELVKMWEEATTSKTVSTNHEERATGGIELKEDTKFHGAATRQILLSRPRSETFIHYDVSDWNASTYEYSNESLPITVAFITNSLGFKITKVAGSPAAGIDIRRGDVDDEGKLLTPLCDLINGEVLPGVSVRFYFLQNI